MRETEAMTTKRNRVHKLDGICHLRQSSRELPETPIVPLTLWQSMSGGAPFNVAMCPLGTCTTSGMKIGTVSNTQLLGRFPVAEAKENTWRPTSSTQMGHSSHMMVYLKL